MSRFSKRNPNGYKIIKTERDLKAINQGVKNGFSPLLKRVRPSDKIAWKYAVIQNKITGEIEQIGDFRADGYNHPDFKVLINWTYYYPHSFPLPYAAYLVPADIEAGEKVWIDDLIEDLVGGQWNQGNVYRLESAEATWDGKDFQIEYDPEADVCQMIG